MRTLEKFKRVWDERTQWIKFHKSSVWLVPLEHDYSLSIIKPEQYELPVGTTAILYDENFEIIDTVKSSK